MSISDYLCKFANTSSNTVFCMIDPMVAFQGVGGLLSCLEDSHVKMIPLMLFLSEYLSLATQYNK